MAVPNVLSITRPQRRWWRPICAGLYDGILLDMIPQRFSNLLRTLIGRFFYSS